MRFTVVIISDTVRGEESLEIIIEGSFAWWCTEYSSALRKLFCHSRFTSHHSTTYSTPHYTTLHFSRDTSVTKVTSLRQRVKGKNKDFTKFHKQYSIWGKKARPGRLYVCMHVEISYSRKHVSQLVWTNLPIRKQPTPTPTPTPTPATRYGRSERGRVVVKCTATLAQLNLGSGFRGFG